VRPRPTGRRTSFSGKDVRLEPAPAQGSVSSAEPSAARRSRLRPGRALRAVRGSARRRTAPPESNRERPGAFPRPGAGARLRSCVRRSDTGPSGERGTGDCRWFGPECAPVSRRRLPGRGRRPGVGHRAWICRVESGDTARGGVRQEFPVALRSRSIPTAQPPPNKILDTPNASPHAWTRAEQVRRISYPPPVPGASVHVRSGAHGGMTAAPARRSRTRPDRGMAPPPGRRRHAA